MDDRSYGRVIEPDFKCRGCDDDVGILVNATVLGRSSSDIQALGKRSADPLEESPVLAGPAALHPVIMVRGPQRCQSLPAAVRFAENIPGFSISQKIEKPIRCVQIICESENPAAITLLRDRRSRRI